MPLWDTSLYPNYTHRNKSKVLRNSIAPTRFEQEDGIFEVKDFDTTRMKNELPVFDSVGASILASCYVFGNREQKKEKENFSG